MHFSFGIKISTKIYGVSTLFAVDEFFILFIIRCIPTAKENMLVSSPIKFRVSILFYHQMDKLLFWLNLRMHFFDIRQALYIQNLTVNTIKFTIYT